MYLQFKFTNFADKFISILVLSSIIDEAISLSLSLRDFLREAEQRICFPRNDKVIFETDPSVSYIIVPTSALINSRLARSKQRSKRNSPPRSLPLSLVSVQLLAVFIRAHVRMARLCVRSRKNRGAGFNRALVFGVNETGRPMLRGGKEIEWTKRGNGERERDPNGAHHGDPSVHRYRSFTISDRRVSYLSPALRPFSSPTSSSPPLDRDDNYPLESFIAVKVAMMLRDISVFATFCNSSHFDSSFPSFRRLKKRRINETEKGRRER